MPTYVYRCLNCDERLEAVQKMTDAPLTTCEECGGSLRRVLQPVGIVFKGSGFYTTDYKRAETGSSSAKSAPAENGKSDSSSPKSDSSKSESPAPKPAETKKETAAAAS